MTARVEAERAIADVLAEHVMVPDPVDWVLCSVAGDCNWEEWKGDENPADLHRAHVASVLADLMAERQAEAWDEGRFAEADARGDVPLSHSSTNPYRLDPMDTRDE